MEYLLVKQGDVFCEADSRHPVIRGGGVWAEGQEVVKTAVDTSSSDMLLLWAAMFPMYNQKIPTTSAQNAVIVLTGEVFQKPCPALRNRSYDRLEKLKAAVP